MIAVEHTRTVDAPVAAVWKVLADFSTLSSWASQIHHSSMMTTQAEGVGACRRVKVGPNVLLERVVEWEPERALAYEISDLPPVVRAVVNRWIVAPDAERTRVSLVAEVTPGPRPPMRLAARLLARRVGAVNASLIDDLATAVEGSR